MRSRRQVQLLPSHSPQLTARTAGGSHRYRRRLAVLHGCCGDLYQRYQHLARC